MNLIRLVMVVIMFSGPGFSNNVDFDFDGEGIEKTTNFALDGNENYTDSIPIPSIHMDRKKINDDENRNLDFLIIHTIKYCEKKNISPDITDGLKKLFIHGTVEEKINFLRVRDIC
ncbi:MAG: hypothetical protein ACP5PA_01900 [Elusimicrobiales bacterium]